VVGLLGGLLGGLLVGLTGPVAAISKFTPLRSKDCMLSCNKLALSRGVLEVVVVAAVVAPKLVEDTLSRGVFEVVVVVVVATKLVEDTLSRGVLEVVVVAAVATKLVEEILSRGVFEVVVVAPKLIEDTLSREGILVTKAIGISSSAPLSRYAEGPRLGGRLSGLVVASSPVICSLVTWCVGSGPQVGNAVFCFGDG